MKLSRPGMALLTVALVGSLAVPAASAAVSLDDLLPQWKAIGPAAAPAW